MVLVSPLSARLLGLQSVDGSLAVQLQRQNPSPPAGSTSSATTNTDSKMAGVATSAPSTANMLRHNMKSHRSTKPRVRPSGYAADQESNSASSNNSCAGLFLLDNEGKAVSVGGAAADPTGTKHRRASQIAEHARKRKVDEMNYSALTVKEALEMAGKSYTYTSQLRSRALPVGSVDMSNVRLVTAGVYREMQQQQSHQPVRVVRCRSTSITSLDEEGDAMHVDGAFDLHVARYSTSIYNALIQDTRQHYNVCPKKRRVSSANAASASSDQPSATQLASRLASVAAACGNLPSQRTERAIDMQSGHSTATPSTPSDTESDISLGAVEVAPRLEEGLMSDVTDEYAALSSTPPSVDKASIILTTIETALSYSQKARLVVSSEDPFRIVHANAAYFRLAGLKSSSIIGQSLSTILEEPSEGQDLRSMLGPTANPSEPQNIAIHKGHLVVDNDQDQKKKPPGAEKSGETEKATSSNALNCHMSISPVSDSSSTRDMTSSVSGRVKITHYLLEFAEAGGTVAGANNKNAANAPDKGFSVIG